MKEFQNEIVFGKSPNRSVVQSPAPSSVTDKHQLLRTSGLSTLKSKRNSQVVPIKEEQDRKLQSKSLVRSSRVSSILSSANTNSKSPVSLKETEKIPGNSADSPDWFKIQVPLCKQNNDDGKISVLSKLNGWIFVSEESKDRKNRAGKKGPFDDQEFNVHKVSGLAPSWMQGKKINGAELRRKNYSPAFSCMNKEEKRLFLFEGNQIDVSFKGEIEDHLKNVEKKKEGTGYKPIILYEWKEPEGNCMKVTGKIGRLN